MLEICRSLVVELHPLFPTVVATERMGMDPLTLACQLQTLLNLRGEAISNPDEGCAWTGDLHGIWQLHQHPDFKPLADEVMARVWIYLERTGFDLDQIALHLQRCWPVLSTTGQVVGRHHHPNAHVSAVVYLSGDGQGQEGALCLHARHQLNELVPGLAVGHGGPIRDHHPHNQGLWTVNPEPGLLVIFPSRLDHSVGQNNDEESLRVSISFDFVLTAQAASAPAEFLAPHPHQWQGCERQLS